MNETLTNRQIAFILFGATVGYGVISLPKNLGEKAGTGGWIVILIATSIIIIFGYIFTYLGNTFRNKTIVEYMPLLTGKFISHLLLIIIIIYEIVAYSLVTRLTSETIKLTALLNTPVWALAVFILMVAFFSLTKKSIRTLARVSEIFGMIIIISGIAIFIAVFTQGDITNIKPIFEFSDIDYIGALSTIAFSLVGIDILAVIPMNTKNKKLFKYILFILLVIALMYILIFESCLSVMGIDSIVHYDEALFATIRKIEIQAFQFLKRLDGIFIIAWLFAIYLTILLEAYVAIYLISKLVKGQKKNIILLIVFFLSLIICLTPPNIKMTKAMLQYVGYLGVFVNVIIPLFLFILMLIKKHKKELTFITDIN